MRCCVHVGHGIAVSVQSGVLALSLSRGITILGVGGGLGLPAGSSETELRAVGSNFACITSGVERVFPFKGKDRFTAGIRGRGIGR